MTCVVDASVVIKCLVLEHGSDRAVQLLEQPVVAPELLVAECVNVLWRKVARGVLTREEAELGVRILHQVGIAFEPMQRLAPDILALSLRLQHSAYDCAYLALARDLGGVMVTADEQFVARCQRPDAADLAPHVRSLFQLSHEVREPRARPYRARRAA